MFYLYSFTYGDQYFQKLLELFEQVNIIVHKENASSKRKI